jgi:hypothetical protein
MEELYFFYQEHLEYTRLYLWFQECKASLFTAQKNKVEAERYKYLSNFSWAKAVERARQMAAK